MLFRNARLIRIDQCPNLDEHLAPALEAWRLKDCGRLEPASAGWVSPFGRDHESLVHSVMGCHRIRFGVQEKVLPPAVIKEALAERAREAENRQGRPPGRREKLRLKDEVLMDLLPRAFVKPRHVDAYLDPGRGWLVVDSASARAADDIAQLLRQSLSGLRLSLPEFQNRVCTHLTHWLDRSNCPQPLELGDECDLRDERDERATVRCRHQDLHAGEIAQHLRAGKQCFRLGLRWAERLSFALSEDLVLARLRPMEALVGQFEQNLEDPLAELDAAFALTSAELGQLLETLTGALELERG